MNKERIKEELVTSIITLIVTKFVSSIFGRNKDGKSIKQNTEQK